MSGCDASLIVPTHNRPGLLRDLVASLAAQTYPIASWELIVVDDGSAEECRQNLRQLLQGIPLSVRQAEQQQQGVAAARNAGARLAKGRVLIFLDDDMIAAPDLVAAHMACQDEPDAVVVGHIGAPASGRQPWTAWEDHQFARHFGRLAKGDRAPGPRDLFSGNFSIPSPLFAAVGGFDVRLQRTEDLDLGYRLQAEGARFVYCQAATATHVGEHSYEKWLRNARLFGESESAIGWRKGRSDLEALWFRNRNAPVRRLVRLCSGRPALESHLIALLDRIGRTAYRTGACRVSSLAYSLIYNLTYWTALKASVGPATFRRELEQTHRKGPESRRGPLGPD